MRKLLLQIIYKIFNKIPEDVNDDGVVNSLDLLLVKQYLTSHDIIDEEEDNNGID